ncbi:TPA: peptide-methionine (S)-S-oxide reductase MsrA [Candidatus Woesearchaeota archaeon]|nr:peptide-methionine (S)-S-oxide reductase MsrA [Candidatus Woesearchaeota archaeon]
MEKATFAAGCFWGIEAAFREIKGVTDVISGYIGGNTKNPTYEQVCSGKTGHAEAVEITFNPEIVSYKKLLEIFWKVHNPISLNRQGLDIGTNYRSAIFYHDEKQKQEAIESVKNAQKMFKDKIVTKITKASEFYKAEEYHQKYLEKHGRHIC